MDGRDVWNGRRRREQKLSRTLMVVAAVVLFGGLIAQIAVRAQVSGQAKKVDAVRREIQALTANAENLNLCINQYHNLSEISQRAQALGMEQPMEDQLRVVSLPQIQEDTSAQTVANDDGEEMIG